MKNKLNSVPGGLTTDGEVKSVPYFETKQAIESLRSSGHDFFSAIGEVIDNPIQANARKISIKLEVEKSKLSRVIIADDGDGMTAEVLPMAIGLGASTRFNNRKGIGRFGVGATLGGISQVRKIEYYSRPKGKGEFRYCCLDIDRLDNNERFIPPAQVKYPDVENAEDYSTIVVWTDADRLSYESRAVKKVDGKKLENLLIHWIGRTYRKFLSLGLVIEVNGTKVTSYDPLFRTPNPRFPEDPVSEELLYEAISWPVPGDEKRESKVHLTVTLPPEEWRTHKGMGGSRVARDRKIDDNEGISILRFNREIFFGVLTHFYPGGRNTEIDRFIGVEIAFDPELDDCFLVRNVKKGAEPIEELRDALRDRIKQLITAGRLRIRSTYKKYESKEINDNGVHTVAEEVAQEVEKTAPPGEVNRDAAPEEVRAKIVQIAKQAVETTSPKDATPEQKQEKVASITRDIEEKPFKILEEAWRGREFMDVEHLAPSKAIIRLNVSHPFYEEVYSPILEALGLVGATGEIGSEEDLPESKTLSREQLMMLKNALELLLISYAKAEGMHEANQAIYKDLRSYWGVFLDKMITELQRRSK